MSKDGTGNNSSADELKKRISSIRIALAGNPNSGKTSLFNCLTGASQRVGNWSGVTVDIIEGTSHTGNQPVTITDLPGTYSLSACSPEEQVARDYIFEKMPDVVVDVIDATNLERHLYLTVQLLELGMRPVLALNMWDEVTGKGLVIDVDRLGKLLGVTVIPTNARTGTGLKELVNAAVNQALHPDKEPGSFAVRLPPELEKAVTELEAAICKCIKSKLNTRWLALQLLEYDRQTQSMIENDSCGREIIALRDKLEVDIKKTLGDSSENFITESRYGFIAGAVRETVNETKVNRVEISDRIDSVLTHRFWAYPVFFAFMWLLFQGTFTFGEYPMHWIQALFAWLGDTVTALLPQGTIRSLLVDGVIAGVGGVIVFLPNILILFLGISIMEDTGYMARAAFIMDKVMHRIGLHGKSFIPMLMGLGCTVPAIMAARTLESRKDRIKTILLTPLISCSARLPVFVLFAGALFPHNAGNMVFLFQVIFGFSAFIFMGLLFKHSLFRKTEDYPFVMELPPYRIPTLRSTVIHMWHKTQHYLKKMGGVVLAFSVILWWAGEYPKVPEIEKKYDLQIENVKNNSRLSDTDRELLVKKLENEKHAQRITQTYIGRIGKVIEPIVTPFGTDWRGAVSLVTGLVAKEVVVGSMGVLYAAGEQTAEHDSSLQNKIREAFTPLSGFAFMLFVLLYTPCLVALVTIIRELKNWKWSLFSLGYQLSFAWIAAVSVYQTGRLLGF